ncbi:nuclear transport factor 2 family protein [Alysiella filiformis]|uniref:SnoaL-like domain-containing protein n=1 Tax=Alysiella filiformis DSM 16848 TaxID=1120981 RepID=A0A286E7T5_9NEIS|nr:nuclear transport factor 2 family protein [Alysiella filiformis]QMT32015.1 nuclear transport factor 2 family protein [Alysiella filiformis]UBQ57076.1 nuclear transport factor 2 family protein [Alysiella filiformis DSM 16848]SOD66977.1 SnoaL-like domain-containing protein [Alysiella filiformis DSM 16848]
MNELQQLLDRQALRDVVDTFSNLADEWRIHDQVVQLFTSDAVVNTHIGGQLVYEMQGHEQIEQVFTDFTKQFKTMYHANGQHTVTFHSETTASAVLYCMVKLANETEIQTHSVRYLDDFVKQDGKWLIAKRVAHFMISESHSL